MTDADGSDWPLLPSMKRQRSVMPFSNDDLRAQYERALERSAARLALLDALPEEDPYEDGQVLRIERTFNSPSKVYMYAVIRIEGAWWLSGRQYVRYGTDKYERMYEQPIQWSDLRRWIVDSGDPQQVSIVELEAKRHLI